MSWRAFNVLPTLAREFDVTYVTTGEEIPPAEFREVAKRPAWRHMQLAGFSLSRCVDELYRRRRIELAVVYASIGFAIRETPFVAIEGGSVYREIKLFAAREPWYRRPRFATGFVHYAVPEMLCIRRAARVVAISESLKQDLVSLHGVPPARVSVVYNGIGPEYLQLFSARSPAARTQALFVGRLHYRKGIVELLEAFHARRDLDVDFVVAGDGPDRAAVERLAGLDPRIRYVGFADRDALARLLTTSTLFVFPTYYEGFGSSLAEAMAAGLGCLVYDTPIAREILADAGVLVPVGDAAAMVDRIGALAGQPERVRALGEKAHRRAADFSWEKCARELSRVLRAELAREADKGSRPC